PYPGLLAIDDPRFFFGREGVVAELLRRLAPGRLLAVVGDSGSGKTSLVRAGIPDGLLVVPGGELPDRDQGVVVVDQFEELFTRCDDAERRAFLDRLVQLRCAVVIGVRADVYGRLS